MASSRLIFRTLWHISRHETTIVPPALPGSLHHHCHQFNLQSYRFVHNPHNPPKTKVKLKKCRPLDAVALQEKSLAPIIKLRDFILKYKRGCVPLRLVLMKRRDIGLKMSDGKLESLMKKYPNIFEFFTHPDDKQEWCRLSEKLLELLEEEKRIHAEQEALVVEKLRRLLMLSTCRWIPTSKLQLASSLFGIPKDFIASIVPKYPEYFKLSKSDEGIQIVELITWDESLAVTELERQAKAAAMEKGLGDIETRGQPLGFKLQYSRGMQLRKKEIQKIDRWQALPFTSPYEKADWLKEGTYQADKRMAALLHELVSLTVEKKIYIHVLKQFREEFNLPVRLAQTFNRYPGIFYTTLKGAVCSIFLREGYEKKQLLKEHPLVDLKSKYHKMLLEGPRLKSLGSKGRRMVQNLIRQREKNALL